MSQLKTASKIKHLYLQCTDISLSFDLSSQKRSGQLVVTLQMKDETACTVYLLDAVVRLLSFKWKMSRYADILVQRKYAGDEIKHLSAKWFQIATLV